MLQQLSINIIECIEILIQIQFAFNLSDESVIHIVVIPIYVQSFGLIGLNHPLTINIDLILQLLQFLFIAISNQSFKHVLIALDLL